MSTVSSSTTSSTAYKVAADTTGTLVLQTGATPTTAVTIDGSQNVGINGTPNTWSLGKALEFGTAGAALWWATSTNVIVTSNMYYNGGYKYAATGPSSFYQQYNGAHNWQIAASGTAGNAITFTQAMTLDASGNLLVGGTSNVNINTNGGWYAAPSAGATYTMTSHASGTASGTRYNYFYYNNGEIGSITQNGTTGVLYNLTSDYRLKNNQEALTGAKDFIMALKPKKWQWWDGSGEGVGFVAHEFMEVAKYSGHGEKDAVETIEIKDEDGNVTGTEERPVYQSIQPSSSEVMANLVSLIQEQQALITQLQADVAALKGAA